MKETGIIMSGDHPTKILDGTKTMTRRMIKPQPYEYAGRWVWAYRKDNLSTESYWLDDCPYGQVGDRLWVRETWAVDKIWDYAKPSKISSLLSIWYASEYRGDLTGKTRPSIFMPRWASRITLEITEVRVERQLDITLGDAIAEGFGDEREFNEAFLRLNPHLKEVNLFVWVLSFKVCN